MKKIVVMLAMSLMNVAYADNLPLTGYYAGVNTGVAFNDATVTAQQLGFTNASNTCNKNAGYSNALSGVQLGYLYQFSNAIISGVEINTTVNSEQKHTEYCNSVFNAGVYDGFTLKNQWQTSVKGRVGREETWQNNIFLPYLTAGVSMAKMGLSYQNEGGNYYSTDAAYAGWLIGAGLEWAITQHWSLRAEYTYIDYGKAIKLNIPTVYGLNDPNGNADVNLSTNTIALGLSYWV